MKYKRSQKDLKTAYKNKRRNAKKRGISFDLTLSEFAVFNSQITCFYTGIPLFFPDKTWRLLTHNQDLLPNVWTRLMLVTSSFW